MENKRRLLIVGDYNRRDFVEAFGKCKNEFEFYFIEYALSSEIKTDFHKEYGQALFWKDFSDAFSLLKKIKPEKVIFFFIESFNHVALNVACKNLQIPTYHLEHGFREYKLETALISNYAPPSLAKNSLKGILLKALAIKDAFAKVKTKLFFFRTVFKTSGKEKEFLRLFYNIRQANNVFHTFKKIKSPYRTADIYLSYSPAIFQAHVKEDHLLPGHPVRYIGMSEFDDWINIKPSEIEEKNIIFIHQPLSGQGFLGWTQAFESTFIAEFTRFCEENGYKLLIKKHPYDYSSIWNQALEEGKAELIASEDFLKKVTKTKIFVGFFSTMLIPVAALPHTVLFTFEGHPQNDLLPSEFLVASGVSEPFYDFRELEAKLKEIATIEKVQKANKAGFINSWMYKFDGDAGKRLRNILVERK
ncbi:polysialyltransferase family glycosyltransferase [Rufibacter soli]